MAKVIKKFVSLFHPKIGKTRKAILNVNNGVIKFSDGTVIHANNTKFKELG